ncbi:DNA polymerase IV [Coralliovum pocilloporae]|uniref:DNA polymerase IV n=1 Tax=Coralliovum pocilloporae TaxID=3066369 RepID=UPI0033073AE6
MTDTDTLSLCRDCLTDHDRVVARCPGCGSPRVLSHPELTKLAIAHIDCDAFYASIEKRDHPELRDKPLIIGGGHRGVVSTACYLARISGVHSAMPMFKAKRLCPEAVVLPPDMEKYSRVGREIRQMMKELTPLVQPLSIDEAFLDLTGTERLHRAYPAKALLGLVRRIDSELALTVSVGLSHNKFLAKVASDLEKPKGFSIIGQAETMDFLARHPVSIVWGVGKAMQKKLAQDGITMLSQIQAMELSDLMKAYGSMGERLYYLSRGIDKRNVNPESDAKSVSAETTFNTDIARFSELEPVLRRLSEKVSARLKRSDIAGHTVVLKLKSKDFRIRTRNRKLHDPTQLADRIFRTGRDLLQRECDGTEYRLLGIGVSDLGTPENADPDDLVDVKAGKRAAAELAMDSLKTRFGNDQVKLGLLFNPAKADSEQGSEPDDDDSSMDKTDQST